MNLLAVEVHQISRTSSDISFDLRLTATINPIPEPTTLTLLWLGASSLFAMRLRHRRVRSLATG
ncbi:MAG: PEP-CTERM sorting domain-containing protein [Chloroflexi bacterium]|nr:PEP-CTERM sorting domain-containing protein [Chloroflexota bacterium]